MITVTLGAFALSGVESYFGGDIAGGVRAAISHYAGRLRRGRPPIAPTDFLGGLPQGASMVAIEATVDPEDEVLCERQARSRGSTVERLAQHAVLVYLAELDLLGVPPCFPPADGDGSRG